MKIDFVLMLNNIFKCDKMHNIILWLIFLRAFASHANAKTILPQGHLKPKVIDDSNEDLNPTNVTHHYPLLPSSTTPAINRFGFCEEEQYFYEFITDNNQTQMLWVTWNLTKVGENAVLPNMCSAQTGLPLRRRCYLSATLHQAVWEAQTNNTVMIQCHNSMFCEAEEFRHHFIHGEGLEQHVNSWKRTKIYQKSTLQDMCLRPNGLPLTRRCLYDKKSHRAQWEPLPASYVNYKCLRTTEQQIISNELDSLLGNVTSRHRINDPKLRLQSSRNLIKILESPSKRRLPADIHLTNEILRSLIAETPDIELSSDVLQITHNLMTSDPTVLRMSAELNATNSLLDTFESYMDSVGDKFVSEAHCRNPAIVYATHNTTTSTDNTLSPPPTTLPAVEVLNSHLHNGIYAHISGNISVFFVNPLCANISGIAIYPSKVSASHSKELNYDSFNDFHYRFIFMNETVNGLLNDPDLELASFVPLSMWQHLLQHFSLLQRSPVIVFKVYAHDGLFVESNTMRVRKPFSKILSISIPGYEDALPESLPFLLRQHGTSFESNPNSGCGYWNYSTWTSGGVQTTSESPGVHRQPLVLCYTSHLTQFSYLIGGSFKQNDLTDEILITSVHMEALDIISLVGCALSLMGLMGIWITACLFKSWRAQASNKILLNMCVALTLQMVLFLFVNTDDISETLVDEHDYTKCVFLGALLQYSLLVLFTWMLLIAFLQFQRYVTVIGIQRPKHYIAKSAVLAWGLPLIPTLLVALIDPKSYVPSTYQLVTDTGICYPSGSGLHFGVILPVSLIVTANLAIFVYVFFSISRSLSMATQRSEKKLVLKQIRLSILLFFLLGLSWIFGIFAFMKMGLVFSYLFCLTATMQGFVLFVYFVILDENSRRCWQQVLCPNRAKKAQKKATELQSMTTASTSNGMDLSHTEQSHTGKVGNT
ncbi:adhesion G-protein coupled receptor G7 [Musca domestica]|uniref:Adhesion G-protein coupled receptor G7 n=1 Tax=Musca domestica TaxID=7370 RepID=A0A1I8M621_MUSDO|nr:adhesion G-protein coupled receptor G7 [Musca domestica]